MAATAASSAPSGARPSRWAWSTRPVPSALVRKTASPLRAPLFVQMPSGCTVPTTASPYFGSSSRSVCPPARMAPAARTASSAPASTSASTSMGSSSGNAVTDRASNGMPPMAKTSLSAFVAAMAPKSRGSSTTGGKKSTVNTSARSSSRRYTAASSAGSRPTSRSAESAGARAPSSASSRAAGYFAAHPPARARLVSVGVATRPSLRPEAGARSRPSNDAGRGPSSLPRRPPPLTGGLRAV